MRNESRLEGAAAGEAGGIEEHPAFVEDRELERRRRLERPFLRRSVLAQLALFGVVLLLWRLPIVNPVKLLVVLVHEMSHVAAAYGTGGTVFGMAIDPGGAGVTIGMGGNEVLIVAAGYFGSLAFGALLYVLGALWDPDEIWSLLTAFCLSTLGLHWYNDFTAFFGIGALALLGVGLFVLSDSGKRFFLWMVATTSCLYPILDVAGEFFRMEAGGFVIHGKTATSDTAQLARLLDVPEIGLVALWTVAGLLTVAWLVGWSARKHAETAVKMRLLRRRKRRWENPELYRYDPDNPSKGPRYVIR